MKCCCYKPFTGRFALKSHGNQCVHPEFSTSKSLHQSLDQKITPCTYVCQRCNLDLALSHSFNDFFSLTPTAIATEATLFVTILLIADRALLTGANKPKSGCGRDLDRGRAATILSEIVCRTQLCRVSYKILHTSAF